MLPYAYDLNFKVDNYTLPDPSNATFGYESLDLSGERDTTGLLHRQMVATKLTWQLSYDALPWSIAMKILSALEPEYFQFTCPNPKTLAGVYSGEFYVGKRSGEIKWITETVRRDDTAIVALSFDIIER